MRRERSGRLDTGTICHIDSGLHFEVGCPKPYVPLHVRLRRKIEEHDIFFSVEFFPPRTPNGVANFYSRLDRYTDGGPLFLDITWHASGDPGNPDKYNSSLATATGALNFSRVDVMLHMTAAQYTKEQTLEHLKKAHAAGIRNILALRGDLHPDDEVEEYKYRAVDLIRWIKEEYGDEFTIACAGYPTGHPEAESYEKDLQFLKEKVDAGAHFIITQLFFEVEVYEKFVKDCRAIGITCPILPGILPIMGYDLIKKIATLSQIKIPDSIMEELEPIKHDDDAVLAYGKKKAIQMGRRLLNTGLAPGIHMYTMNREGAIRDILKELRLWKDRRHRLLPWEPHGVNHPKRCEEDVRPIYWSCRPKSYITRTQDWDGYPNGRWGNSSSPCFAALNEYYIFAPTKNMPHPSQISMLGEPRCLEDIKRVFFCYLSGGLCRDGPGTEVRALPWSEDMDGVARETSLIQELLLWCISRGILTINSQPNVDGADSTDPTVGWGNPGGYVYQKAYLEFFCPLEMSEILAEIIAEKYYPRINYHCINAAGTYERMNGEPTTPIAVTWGVFPGREIAQPTVVDPLAFMDWKDEAFNLWKSGWSSIYPKASDSRRLLNAVHDTYILFTMVDNDYKKNNIIFEIVKEAADRYDSIKEEQGLGLDNYMKNLPPYVDPGFYT